MWLVLSERGDLDAQWAQRGLLARRFEPVELVTVDELVAARRWEHRLGVEHGTVTIELSDGRVIEGGQVRGALNRLVAIPSSLVERAVPTDREYATQELYAFFLSWLAALPGRILNDPTPQGLSGCWLERSEWLVLAAAAGLDPGSHRWSSNGNRAGSARPSAVAQRRTILVIGDRALGPPGVPTTVVAGCGRLARSLHLTILGVEFLVEEDGRWTFGDATTVPVLRRGGERALDLLAVALDGSAAGSR
jgi:hypothetical protein